MSELAESPEELHQRAHAALSAGRASEAVDLLEHARASDAPAVFDSTLGVALQLIGRNQDAVDAYQRAIVVQRAQLAALHHNLGTALAALGRLEDAGAAYEDALAVQPDQQQALLNLGVVRRHQGRMTEAEACFRAVLSRAPDDPDARSSLGSVLCTVGRYEEAVTTFRRLAAADPQSVHAATGLGASLAGLGRHDEALEECRRAIALDPEFGEAHRHLGASLVVLERLDEALAAADRACALSPDDAEAHEVRGAALAELRRLDEARAEFEQAVALSPERARPYTNLGAVAERQSAPARAEDAFRRALACEPDNRTALIGLAGALAIQRRPLEALAVYRRLIELDPHNAGVRHMIDALEGKQTAAPPDGYIQQVFDAYAPRFERNLIRDLGYRAPVLVRDAIAPHGRFPEALDLGCGTGLVGLAIRELVDLLHGVDLSPKMLDEARGKAVYDQLVVGELVAHLAADRTPRYALIVSADVLIYLGDLEAAFAAARARLAPGGLFCFTLEACEGVDYRLEPTGRYAHSRAYLERLAAAHDYQVRTIEPAELRHEHKDPVIGWLILLAAPGASSPLTAG